MDWMQELREWFSYYLRHEGEKPWLGVEIQSNQGSWRLEDRYPMSETTEILWELGSAELSAAGGSNTILPNANSGPVYETPPLEENLYFGGLPRLHVNVNTVTVGGQIYALLEDCDGSTCIHIGHAIMDLRYHAGGTDEQAWAAPFEEITALMEFFAMDVEVAAGHTIRLSLRVLARIICHHRLQQLSQSTMRVQRYNSMSLIQRLGNTTKFQNVRILCVLKMPDMRLVQDSGVIERVHILRAGLPA